MSPPPCPRDTPFSHRCLLDKGERGDTINFESNPRWDQNLLVLFVFQFFFWWSVDTFFSTTTVIAILVVAILGRVLSGNPLLVVIATVGRNTTSFCTQSYLGSAHIFGV